MKNPLRGVALGLCLGLILGASPLQAADEQPYRFAVVNLARVLGEAPQASAQGRRLEALFSAREAALAQEQIDLQQARETFQLNAKEMSAADRVQKERELRTMQRDYTRKQEDFREEVRVAKDAALERVQEQVEQAIEAVRAQQNIDIVFRENSYVAASSRVNMTEQVLVYLRQQFEQESQQSQPSAAPTDVEEGS